jgi:heat-inducible transcriptional repressor
LKLESLTERERSVLQAVVDSYIRTAEPTGSRRLVQHYELGVSPATVRNTMADLEAKGLLTHPHTSAGRIPTDLAYRCYVDGLMDRTGPTIDDEQAIHRELLGGDPTSEIGTLVRRAARVLGLLTGELGLAVGPIIAEAVLVRLDLVPVDSEKALLVLTLESGVVRTVYVDVPTAAPEASLNAVARVLNERLVGSTLREIHSTLSERLRDVALSDESATELVNIFVESGPEIFEWAIEARDVHLGNVSVLADQPEFTTSDRLRRLMELTERRDLLASVLGGRTVATGPQITIGEENSEPELSNLTVVTATFLVGHVEGVVGVIGPTRMPYEKVVALVDCTSSLVSRLVRN